MLVLVRKRWESAANAEDEAGADADGADGGESPLLLPLPALPLLACWGWG